MRNERKNSVDVERRIFWGERNGEEAVKEIEEAYKKIVFWKKDLFMLPTDAVGKNYITEVTKLVNQWVYYLPIKNIAFKAIHAIPRETSKSKDHINALH